MLVTPPSPSGPDVGTLQSGQEHFIPTRFASRSTTCLLNSSLANLPPLRIVRQLVDGMDKGVTLRLRRRQDGGLRFANPPYGLGADDSQSGYKLIPIINIIKITLTIWTFITQHRCTSPRGRASGAANLDFVTASLADETKSIYLAVVALNVCVTNLNVNTHAGVSVRIITAELRVAWRLIRYRLRGKVHSF